MPAKSASEVSPGGSSQSAVVRASTIGAASCAGGADAAAALLAATRSATSAAVTPLRLTDAARTPSAPSTTLITVISCARVVPLVVNVLLAQRMLTLWSALTMTMQSRAVDA